MINSDNPPSYSVKELHDIGDSRTTVPNFFLTSLQSLSGLDLGSQLGYYISSQAPANSLNLAFSSPSAPQGLFSKNT
jgi:hypothetical protein